MSSLDLSARSPAQRCPYCHDHIASAPELVIACAGCGTIHHAACLAELGRCTVLGAKPDVTVERDLSAPGIGAVRAAIRERAQSRARAFVRRYVAPAPNLADLELRRAFEKQVAGWLPEFLEVALSNLSTYDPAERAIIWAAHERRLPNDPAGS